MKKIKSFESLMVFDYDDKTTKANIHLLKERLEKEIQPFMRTLFKHVKEYLEAENKNPFKKKIIKNKIEAHWTKCGFYPPSNDYYVNQNIQMLRTHYMKKYGYGVFEKYTRKYTAEIINECIRKNDEDWENEISMEFPGITIIKK